MEYDDTLLDFIDNHADELDGDNPWEIMFTFISDWIDYGDETEDINPIDLYEFLVNELNFPDLFKEVPMKEIDPEKAEEYMKPFPRSLTNVYDALDNCNIDPITMLVKIPDITKEPMTKEEITVLVLWFWSNYCSNISPTQQEYFQWHRDELEV